MTHCRDSSLLIHSVLQISFFLHSITKYYVTLPWLKYPVSLTAYPAAQPSALVISNTDARPEMLKYLLILNYCNRRVGLNYP